MSNTCSLNECINNLGFVIGNRILKNMNEVNRNREIGVTIQEFSVVVHLGLGELYVHTMTSPQNKKVHRNIKVTTKVMCIA